MLLDSSAALICLKFALQRQIKKDFKLRGVLGKQALLYALAPKPKEEARTPRYGPRIFTMQVQLLESRHAPYYQIKSVLLSG